MKNGSEEVENRQMWRRAGVSASKRAVAPRMDGWIHVTRQIKFLGNRIRRKLLLRCRKKLTDVLTSENCGGEGRSKSHGAEAMPKPRH